MTSTRFNFGLAGVLAEAPRIVALGLFVKPSFPSFSAILFSFKDLLKFWAVNLETFLIRELLAKVLCFMDFRDPFLLVEVVLLVCLPSGPNVARGFR